MKQTTYTHPITVNDAVQLLNVKKGQWVRFGASPQLSRFHSMDKQGKIVAFHYPDAGKRFNAYTRAEKPFQMKLVF